VSCGFLLENFVDDAKSDNIHGRLPQITNLENSRWWKNAMLKIILLQYFGEIYSNFDEILQAVADWDCTKI